MAKILEYKDIPLEDLVIGRGQARTVEPGKEVDELVHSIEIQGLLQPIVVCEATQTGKWEILSGQRRFLAHRMLKKETIPAAIINERVSEAEAKAISITENLIRRKLSGKELKDGILYLYKMYGTIKDVVAATGLPIGKVRENLKYPRLIPKLQKMVDDNEVDINVALKSQDAACEKGNLEEPNAEVAVTLAREMSTMTGAQRKTFAKQLDTDMPIEEAVEKAKSGADVVQAVITLTKDTHSALQKYTREEKTNQDEAIVMLIEEGLTERGLLEGKA